jgi:hypothetical protein
MCQWLLKVEAYLEIQCLTLDNEQIHFTQFFFNKHAYDWRMAQKQEMCNLLEILT